MGVRAGVVPLLERARQLYAMPRGRERFDAYIALGTAGTQEMQTPIAVMNPMGKEHVLAYVERLIELDAEAVAAGAAREAAERLTGIDDDLQIAVVVADDLKGGWTNRAFTEFAQRYERKYEVERGWATTLLWTSEEPDRATITARTLESIYRTIDERANGPVNALGTIMDREGRTQRFAGRTGSRYDRATLERIARTIDAHRVSVAAPVIMASLYGDAIAESLGYPLLGVPAWGGYELAIARATAEAVR